MAGGFWLALLGFGLSCGWAGWSLGAWYRNWKGQKG